MSCCGGGGDLTAALRREQLENNTPLGVYLTAQELEQLANFCATCKIRPGQLLPESPFYVVMTGQAEVHEDDKVLCTKSQGAFFTRRAGLVKGQTRKSKLGKDSNSPTGGGSPLQSEPIRDSTMGRASIVKASAFDSDALDFTPPSTKIVGKLSGMALMITPENLDEYLGHLSQESSDVVTAILHTNIGTQLAQVPFIEQAALEPADLRALGEVCSYAVYAKGKPIFVQGDAAENFYIILKGKVGITIDVTALRGTGDGKVAAATRSVGDSFGVAALVYNAPQRKYSATASEKCLCLVISKLNFERFHSTKPSLESGLLRTTKLFLLQRYKAMNVPIFGSLAPQSLTKAADLSTFVHFEPGQTVYCQGDAPEAFYVVLHGEVKMSSKAALEPPPAADGDEGGGGRGTDIDGGSFVKESKRIASSMMSESWERVLTVGEHFGEVGIVLPQTPCIATVTALTRCSTLTLKSSAFLELFGSDANLMAEMQLKLLKESSSLKAALTHTRCRPLFVRHIEGEYSAESIYFYDAMSELLSSASSLGDDACLAKAKEIIAEYVREGANQQVNIPGPQQKAVTAAEKAGDVAALLKALKIAQGEIYLLMARDNFPRFTKSQPFQDLLSEIGTYGDSVKDLVSGDDLTMLLQDGDGAEAPPSPLQKL